MVNTLSRQWPVPATPKQSIYYRIRCAGNFGPFDYDDTTLVGDFCLWIAKNMHIKQPKVAGSWMPSNIFFHYGGECWYHSNTVSFQAQKKDPNVYPPICSASEPDGYSAVKELIGKATMKEALNKTNQLILSVLLEKDEKIPQQRFVTCRNQLEDASQQLTSSLPSHPSYKKAVETINFLSNKLLQYQMILEKEREEFLPFRTTVSSCSLPFSTPVVDIILDYSNDKKTKIALKGEL